MNKANPGINIKYAIVAISRSDIETKVDDKYELHILHSALYENPPTLGDYINLYKELKTNDEFKLDVDFVLVPASDEMLSSHMLFDPEIDKV